MAAHLHDSVLQTLALIQKNAHDPAFVARLARAQERDLRVLALRGREHQLRQPGRRAARLSRPRSRTPTGSPSTWSRSATAPSTEPLRALVSATREAMTNAAKHAGTGMVDVYAEVIAVGGRRLRPRPGRRASTRTRSRRTGWACGAASWTGWTGTAAPRRSAPSPGEGTEVRLHLPRTRPKTRTSND